MCVALTMTDATRAALVTGLSLERSVSSATAAMADNSQRAPFKAYIVEAVRSAGVKRCSCSDLQSTFTFEFEIM